VYFFYRDFDTKKRHYKYIARYLFSLFLEKNVINLKFPRISFIPREIKESSHEILLREFYFFKKSSL